ncbi:hypothetical protein P7H41_13770, partial [Vagococcus fluvialis]|uniref:hypothetical protein n=1 Tax=Vagococcus fluvialis TaxID=2738 RepID=UPI00288F31DC
TLILQNGLSFYLPKISIYTKYFTLSIQPSKYKNKYNINIVVSRVSEFGGLRLKPSTNYPNPP